MPWARRHLSLPAGPGAEISRSIQKSSPRAPDAGVRLDCCPRLSVRMEPRILVPSASAANRGEQSQQAQEDVDYRQVDPDGQNYRVAKRVFGVADLLDLIDEIEAEDKRTGKTDANLENCRVDEDLNYANRDES